MKKNINPNLLKLAELTYNPNLKIDKSILEEKVDEPLQTQANINLKDYVKFGNILIAKYEPDKYKGLTWKDTHFKLNEDGLFMPSPALFMPYFLNVIEAHKRKTTLYDGAGNQLTKKEIEDIYKHLTTNHINGGAWSWLDADFKVISNKLHINCNHKIINNNLKQQTSVPLEQCLMEDCYVDLEFNQQGLPTNKSRKQEYKQGENIRYWYPRSDNNSVAGFWAGSGRASLYFNGNPDSSNASLGVFSCAEGAKKLK